MKNEKELSRQFRISCQATRHRDLVFLDSSNRGFGDGRSSNHSAPLGFACTGRRRRKSDGGRGPSIRSASPEGPPLGETCLPNLWNPNSGSAVWAFPRSGCESSQGPVRSLPPHHDEPLQSSPPLDSLTQPTKIRGSNCGDRRGPPTRRSIDRHGIRLSKPASPKTFEVGDGCHPNHTSMGRHGYSSSHDSFRIRPMNWIRRSFKTSRCGR